MRGVCGMRKKYISPDFDFDSFTLKYNICLGDTDDPGAYGIDEPSVITTMPVLPETDPFGD